MATIQIDDTEPRVQYDVGSTATTGPFSVPFPFFKEADVVVLQSSGGTATELVNGTDYSFSAKNTKDDGFQDGEITLSASVSDVTLTIYRRIVIERTDDFPQQGPFNVKALNTTLDRLYAIGQELDLRLQRAVTLTYEDDRGDITLPAAIEGKPLIWENGNLATATNSQEGYTTESKNWANYPVDSLVPEGDGVDDYSALHHATKAGASATAAAASENAAATSETNAATSESNAAASEGLAQQWATEAEDVEVTTGEYSAYHWAKKAEGSGSTVTTVNGQDGNVTLNASDVSATPASHVGSGGTAQHPAATTSVAGFMAAADKTKLNGVQSGATNYTDSDAKAAVGKADVGLGNVPNEAQIAQGKHTIGLPAAACTTRATDGAEQATIEFSTNNLVLVGYDFDAATEEAIQVAVPMPVSSNESAGLTAIVGWTETAGNSGDVVWGLSALALGNDDAIDSALGTEVTVTDTRTAQGDLMQTAETATITPAGTWAAGDLVLVQLARKAGNGSDTLGGDARFVNLRLFYTINAATDA